MCDKGVGAALFMALFRSLIRSAAQQRPAGRPDAEHVLHTARVVNDYIATTHGASNMFATAFLGVLDPASGRLVYVCAGHEAPAVAASGNVRQRLEPTGPALGLLPGLDFEAAEATLAPGETLVAFTDGVTDAQAPDGSFFSEERLLSLVATPAPSSDVLLDRVDAALAEHVAGGANFDDVTLLVLQRAAQALV